MEDEELKSIVEKMVAAGESEENIALVIKNYKPKNSSSPTTTTNSSPLDYAELVSGGTVNTLT